MRLCQGRFVMNGIDIEEIKKMLQHRHEGKKGPAVLAVDGRCAAGKSTLGEKLAAAWNAPLFHMDDFYLQPHQRTKERLAEPGGNVDRERFLSEVLLPLCGRQPVFYRRFDCGTLTFEPPRQILPGEIAIIEGSYSCHPELRDHYDLRIFLDIDPDVQRDRILRRNGPEVLKRFIGRWIPLEEAYFSGCAVRECCDLVFRTE